MSTVFLKILNMSMDAIWIILAAVVFRFVFRRASKWVNGILWALVAIKLTLPFSLESIFSLVPRTEFLPKTVYNAAANLAPQVSASSPLIPAGTQHALPPLEPASPVTGELTSTLSAPDFISLAAYAWLIGATVLLCYLVITSLHIKRRVAAAVHIEENVYVCDDIESPFIFGLVKPKIYIPSGLSEANLKYVLAHEHAHISRKDYILKIIGYLVLAVHWFNPLVWLSYFLFCRDIEMACDEKVLARMHSVDRAEYSESLLSFYSPKRKVFVFNLAFGELGVKERVKGIMKYKKPSSIIMVLAVAACVIAAACFLTKPVTAGGEDVQEVASPSEISEVAPELGAAENGNTDPGVEDWAVSAAEPDLPEGAPQDDTITSESAQWIWPCANTRITSMYGERIHPVDNSVEWSDHISIEASEGDEVFAVFPGTVETAEFDDLYGYYVVILHNPDANHEGEIKTFYRHLSSISVNVGDVVSAGTTVGIAGNTGMATGIHVSFGVLLNGEAVDPLEYLNQ